jgi:hypothetical protein
MGQERLGHVASAAGAGAGARRLLAAALAGYRELGDRMGMASVQVLLGRLALRGGAAAAARERFAEGLRTAQAVGYLRPAVEGLEGLAAVAAAQGQAERALHLAGAAATLWAAAEKRPPQADAAELARSLAPARTALGTAGAAQAWAAGQSMTLEQAVADALADAPDAA